MLYNGGLIGIRRAFYTT